MSLNEKKIKKYVAFGKNLIIALFIFGSFLSPFTGIAAAATSTSAQVTQTQTVADLEISPLVRGLVIFGTYLGLPSTDPRSILSNIIRTILGFLSIIFLLMILYGGLIWMTSGGDDEKVTKARRTLINAIIGIVIILSANSIVTYLVRVLIGS